jgi:hypothetical protein
MDPAERASLLDRALADEIPESHAWTREALAGSWRVVLPSTVAPSERRLEIELRPDGDVDVRFHYSRASRGPAEAHGPVDAGREAEVFREVARFVADLLAERVVLAFRRGWFRGGREFIPTTELTPERRRRLAQVVSWRGTHDWVAPARGR